MTSQHKNNMDVKHPQVTGKCKFGEKCTRPLTCPFKHDFKNSKKGLGKQMMPLKHLSLKVNHNDFLQKMLPQLRSLSLKRSLFAQEKKDFDSKYGSLVDVKGLKTTSQIDDKIALLDMEFKTLKSMAHNTFGTHPVKVNMHIDFTWTTSTAGLCATVDPVQPNTLTEFTALAALFDQYRVTGGKSTINLYGYMLYDSQASGVCKPLLIIVYDPSDFVAVASVLAGSNVSQHKLLRVPVATAAVTGPLGFPDPQTQLHEFHWKTPPGILDSASVGSEGGAWQATISGAQQLAYGTVKVYGGTFVMSAAATATNIAYVLQQYNCEYRMRE